MFTSSMRGHADDLQNPAVVSLTEVKSCPRRQQVKLLRIALWEPTEHSCCLLSQVFIRRLLVDKRSVSYISTLWLLWCCSVVTVYGSNNSNVSTDPEVGRRWSAATALQQWRLSKRERRRAASQRSVPHVSSCWLMGLGVGQDSVSFPKHKTLHSVEMKPAIASQHCQLEASESTLIMKSVRNVRWMWRRGSTMRPFFTLLKCDILPFVFPPRGLYLWMKERAEWSTCSRDGGDIWMSGNTHTHTHTHTHTGVWANKHTQELI